MKRQLTQSAIIGTNQTQYSSKFLLPSTRLNSEDYADLEKWFLRESFSASKTDRTLRRDHTFLLLGYRVVAAHTRSIKLEEAHVIL